MYFLAYDLLKTSIQFNILIKIGVSPSVCGRDWIVWLVVLFCLVSHGILLILFVFVCRVWSQRRKWLMANLWMTIGRLRKRCSSSCNISNTKDSVWAPLQTPRRELKIRHAAEYFWRNSRCLDSRWNTVSSVWHIFSIETKTKEKTEK